MKRADQQHSSEARYEIQLLRVEQEGYTLKGLMEAAGLSKKEVQKALSSLRADGFIKTLKVGNETVYVDKDNLEKIQAIVDELRETAEDNEAVSHYIH